MGEIDGGTRPGTTTEDKARIAALEEENRELRRANEILKSGGCRTNLDHRAQDPRWWRSCGTWPVVELSLGEFVAAYRPDARGSAAYDPAMMVALVVYAYCVGERSSRRIQRRGVVMRPRRTIPARLSDDTT